MGGVYMVNIILICICIIIFLWLIVSHFGVIWKIFYNSILGMLALMFVNLIGSPFNIIIGINAVTCLICGILGIPGFLMLLVLRFLVH